MNFQKSKESTSSVIYFTINLGVCSTALRKELNGIDSQVKPEIEDCHWRRRIGFLMDHQKDYWWQLDSQISIESLINEVSLVINSTALPGIKKHISDIALEEEWLGGRSDGLTKLQKYIYMTTLMKFNDRGNLLTYLDELRSFAKGKSFEYTALEHIERLKNINK